MRFGDVEAANPFLSKGKAEKGKAEEGAIVSSKSKGNANASIGHSNDGMENPKTPAKNEEEKHLKIHPLQFIDAMIGN
ncbi:hypothetical protein niasHT_008762 [Heterodera trifolii]|uniref:Uncharacterized protein n=1 Tax=Heterodera trifolii TaxID=157864 RepID=A0ABD2M2U3_9BILA